MLPWMKGKMSSGSVKRVNSQENIVELQETDTVSIAPSIRKESRKESRVSKKFSTDSKKLSSIIPPQSPELYKTCRKPTRLDYSKYRRGPVPVECLPRSERLQASTTNATLETNIDDEEEGDFIAASNRALMIYFAQLGNSTDENEKVEFDFLDSLLQAGANFNYEDRYGQTAVHAIARDWHPDVALYAIDHGADVNKPDRFGRTPLHLVSAVDYNEMVIFLEMNGADLDCKTYKEEQTPLHYAAKNNAVSAMKTLIRLGAAINERDHKGRTPLFIAAETGRADAVRVLLDNEAPAGVYDINGNSALSLMVEKMPAVAYEALTQFYVDDRALRRKYYYLSYLESQPNKREKGKDLAKSVLEMIVVYREADLVMHPVIQKLISIKWDLFSWRKSTINLMVNLVYTIIWTALALAIPRNYRKFYIPYDENGWRIGLEIIFIMMSFSFVIIEIRSSRKNRALDMRWKLWRRHTIELDYEFCHPKWQDERKYVESETQRVDGFKGTYSRNFFWSVYEWISLSMVFAVFGTQTWLIISTSKLSYQINNVCLCVSVLMVWLRLLKVCRAFTFLSAFIVLLGHVFGATLRFAFLFFELFIPYVCIMWIIFGGEENAEHINIVSPGDGRKFEKFNDIIFYTWQMTVISDIPFAPMVRYRRKLALIIVGSYYAIVSVVCLNLYIALMSETFTRVYSNAKATASLQQSLLILLQERDLGPLQSIRVTKYFNKMCSPLEDIQYEQNTDKEGLSRKEMNNTLTTVNRQLHGVLDALDQGKQVKDEGANSEERTLGELRKKTSATRQCQEDSLNHIHSLLDGIVKQQGALMKSVNIAVDNDDTISRSGSRSGGKPITRSRSSQSLA